MKKFIRILGSGVFVWSLLSWGGVDSSLSGNVTDPQGVAVPNATVKLLTSDGREIAKKTSSATGDFQFFPITFGDYDLEVDTPDYAPYKSTVHVNSGVGANVDVHLEANVSGKEIVVEVKAKKKHLVQSSNSTSSNEITKDDMKTLPEGNEVSLPKLLTSTQPGVVAGPFGQMFFRGNHANIQYQIDGIQLPDSPSNTFGDAFSPRNIDHMEVITGGIPSEYGERLASVVNIVTKSGPEVGEGEAALSYGSYNTWAPHLLYGGSNESGSLHYFVSGSYSRTDRGLDTPQPESESNQKQGTSAAVHDNANSNSEFAKVDWYLDNEDKLTFITFNSINSYQIPNYSSDFKSTDAFFQQGFTDQFGNTNGPTNTTFTWVPSTTNDTQYEENTYVETVWKRTLSDRAFLQIAPYWKYSRILVDNDPSNDLTTGITGSPNFITGATPSSFYENRAVHNFGLKGDYTNRFNEKHLFKAGFQGQWSRSSGTVSVQTTNAGAPTTPSVDTNPDTGTIESVYAQDDFTITKSLILNAGLRFDATQFHFADASPTDSLLQPRIGLNYFPTETTKLHAFYGKLFMPAPVEDLRDTFVSAGTGQLTPYDIKAEKDDYFEVGVAQQVGDQVLSLNSYYKLATNMLDDAELLNSSIAQPYNFAKGFAYGIEFSVKGQLGEHWSDYFNYSFEIAKGKGISGGLFAFSPGQEPTDSYQYLDHVQVHTANAGLTYSRWHWWATAEELFGSGLRTGPNNSNSLPSHFTTDLTVGYEFHGQKWWSKWKVSGDALNIFDNMYPITVANGFNGSHYAAGREFFLRVSKDL